MRQLLVSTALIGSLTFGVLRSDAEGVPANGANAPVDAQWRDMTMNGRAVVTGVFRHPGLDFDRTKVRVLLANGKLRGPKYYRKMLDRGRRFQLQEISGGTRLRVDAKGRGDPTKAIEQLRMVFYSKLGQRLGRSVHTVGASGGGGGDGTR